MRSVSAQQQTIILPLYAQMTVSDMDRVVEALRAALAEATVEAASVQHAMDIAVA
jgi:dTDP-4-amino-4,6-dideoxygalactose transaminase